MEESQQQHLLSVTLLNLKLTRETIAEKDRLLALKEEQLAEIDQKLTEKERQLAEKELQILGKDHQIAIQQAEIADKDRLIADKDNQLAKKDRRIADQDVQLTKKDHQVVDKDHQITAIAMKDEWILGALAQIQLHIVEFTGGTYEFARHTFTLEKFSKCQKQGSVGDWYSEPFFSQPGNCKVQLNVETKCIERVDYMKVRLKRDSASKTAFIIGLQLLNQQTNCSHYFRMHEVSPGFGHTSPWNYIQFKELYKRDKEVQYLKDDCLKFVLWIKTKN
jgi:hypothetical protein